MGYFDAFMKKVQEDVEKYNGRRELTRANLIDILTVRHLPPERLHVNPDDDFANPEVGPNERIVGKYMEEAKREMAVGEMSFEDPIMVAKMKAGDYMIVNGHHRWAAAVRVGLKEVRVVIVNPGKEDLAYLLA